MMTASEEILSRYKVTAQAVDAFGRTWTVRRLRPSQQTAVGRIGGGEGGQEGVSILVASVARMRDEQGRDFDFALPRTQQAIDDLLDVMDAEGIAAVGEALKSMAVVAGDVTAKAGEATGDAPAA